MTEIQKIIKAFAIFLAIFIIVSIVSSLMLVFGLFTDLHIGKHQKNRNFSEIYHNIQNIDVDLTKSNIRIQEGTVWKVEASGIDQGFSVQKKGTTLEIEEKEKWFFGHRQRGEITVYVPKGEMGDLKIDGGVGEIELTGITAKQLDIDCGVGYLKITDSKFLATAIDSGVGKTEISSSTLNHLDIDGGVGKIDIEAYITGVSKIECGVGEISILLLGEEKDYTIFAEKGLGSTTINGQQYSNQTVYGSGHHKIEVEGGIGKLELNFKQKTLLESN